MRGNKSGKIYKAICTAKGKLEYAFVPVYLDEMNQTFSKISQANFDLIGLKEKIETEMNDILQKQLKRIDVIPPDQSPPAENP